LFQDLIYFAGADSTHGNELWKSDGTSAGTKLVADVTAGSKGSEQQRHA